MKGVYILSAFERLKLLIFGTPLDGEDDIKPISLDQRRYNWLDIFLIFSGTQIAISFFVVGSGTVQGLEVWQAFLAVFLGYGVVGGILCGIIGKIGFREGIPTMVASRSPFGIRGSILPVIITFIQLSGWTAVQVALGGSALSTLIIAFNPKLQGQGILIFSVLIVGLATILIATRGGMIIKKMSKIVVPILLLSLAYVAYIAMDGHTFSEILTMKNEGDMKFLSVFDVMIISALTWVPLTADYTRMAKSERGSLHGIWMSLLLVTPIVHLIGMISSVGLGVANPLTALDNGAGSLIALFMILFATLTTSVLILYSTAMAGINVVESFGKKIPLWLISTIVGIPAILLATRLEVVFFVIPFLEYLGIALAPMFGIMIADYFVTNKGAYQKEHLYAEGSGKYWGFKGFNVAGYTSWIFGAIVYYILLTYVKPDNQWVIVSIISMLVAGIVYSILKKQKTNEIRNYGNKSVDMK